MATSRIEEVKPPQDAASTAIANEILHAHLPTPAWAVQDVLLSADMAPTLLGPLEHNSAAPGACTRA